MGSPRFVIVVDNDQLRRALRLRDVLRSAFDAQLFDAQDFSRSPGAIPSGAGLLFLGDHAPARCLRALIQPMWEGNGVSFGLHGRKALIQVDLPEKGRHEQLRTLSRRLVDLDIEVADAVRRSNPDEWSGLTMAGWFLGGSMQEDEDTDIVEEFNMSLDAALTSTAWDIGVVKFLIDGFDTFREHVTSAE